MFSDSDLLSCSIKNSTVYLNYESNQNSKTWFDALDKRALDLIFWLDSNGVYIVVDLDTEREHQDNVWTCDIWQNDNVTEVGYYGNRPTALEFGILKAFELLKDKP